MTIIAKYIPAPADYPMPWPSPNPQDGQVAVPVPENLCWQALNLTVTQDEQGNWIFTENQEQLDTYWRYLRQERNNRLAEVDWTQLADVTENKAAWAVYRQTLRNLPANTKNPAEPQWPQKPE